MSRSRVFHPILVSLYPVLTFLGVNEEQVRLSETLRSLIGSLMIGGIVWILLLGVMKNRFRAGTVATLLVALFFSYGHLYNLVEDVHLVGFNLGRHRFLILFMLLLGIASVWASARIVGGLARLNPGLNVFSVILVAIPLGQLLLGGAFRGATIEPGLSPEGESANAPSQANLDLPVDRENLPDIYYLIPDMYTSAWVLRERFGFDNSEFIRWLEARGFYVAACSQSNYRRTVWSLSSTMNLNYLEQVSPAIVQRSDDPYAFSPYVKDNTLRAFLEEAGYTIVALETGFSPTEWTDADVYAAYTSSWHHSFTGGLNSFETTFLRTTAGLLLFDFADKLPLSLKVGLLDSAYAEHRGRILYALDELETLSASIDSPKLVFFHILAPHNPFVFGPSGEILERETPFTLNNDLEYTTWEKFSEGYVGQIQYLNRRFQTIIQGILESSGNQAVIILQGDHGVPRLRETHEKFAILNAYRLPGAKTELYPTITPVNTFRWILAEAFQWSEPLLADLSFESSSDEQPYTFDPVQVFSQPCLETVGEP